MITRSEPVFAVRDVQQTVQFYKDNLDGKAEWFWGDPPDFAGIRIGGFQLLFCQQPELAKRIEGHQHFISCDNVEEMYQQHLDANLDIISPLGNKPWGVSEYVLRDPNGYHLRLTGHLIHEKSPDAKTQLPETIRFEFRLPTQDEYLELQKSVGWTAKPHNIEQCCLGIVAIDRNTDQTVGMARVINEAKGWYSIWDVVVRPEYQSQRIGSSILQNTLDQLRKMAPAGSNVFLFTFKHAFYEKLGFKKDTCSMIKL